MPEHRRRIFRYRLEFWLHRMARRPRPCAGVAMNTQYGVLIRFVLLYSGLFSAFGLVSPFLPAFLGARGLRAEELGLLLGAGTAVRLLCGPLAGRLAARFHIFRAGLAVFAILAAPAALLY